MFRVAIVDDEAEERNRIQKCLDYVAQMRQVSLSGVIAITVFGAVFAAQISCFFGISSINGQFATVLTGALH